jgi:hypothetical protein
MIAILASIISTIWMVVLLTQFTPFQNDPERVGALVLLIAFDGILFLLGVITLILATKKRYPWRIAALITVTPLLHWLGSMIDVLGVVVIVVPSVLILLTTGLRQFRKLRSDTRL